MCARSGVRRKAVLLDVSYSLQEDKCHAKLELKGRKAATLYYEYDPYFYVDAPHNAAKTVANVQVKAKDGEIIFPKKVEGAEKEVEGKKRKLLKVICSSPSHVPILEKEVGLPCYEYSIPFGRRFMMDFGLMPLSIIHYERRGKYIKKFTGSSGDGSGKLNVMAFDIETYNPEGAPMDGREPALMISYSNGKKHGVLSWKGVPEKEFVEAVADEKELIGRFCALLDELDVDVLTAYNSTNFDLPYLKERAKRLKVELAVGRDGTSYRPVKRGLIQPLKIRGRVHVDLYPSVRFFGFTGMIKTGDYTLKNVYLAITGKKKLMVERADIWKMWDNGGAELEELSDYSLMDADSTYEIGEHILPIQMELSEIAGLPLFDVAYATSGRLVEALLMREAVASGMVVPPKPSGAAVNARSKNPIKGGYVKLPEPGIYENIAVFDFRGLYPSIICSYNIDPGTIGREGESWESPTGARFLKKPTGLVPRVLGELTERRAKLKEQLKKLKKGSAEYNRAYARSYALKILANSFYGYLGYARSRWYNRSCAESTTAFGRKHIQETEKLAKEAGFRVLYQDTDSIFILLGEKGKEDAISYMEKVNSSLPGKMELELEDFYTRGVFVSKKHQKETTGAKKKYAMLSEDGSIKIRGFELVRRDWSKIARETQRRVLEAILRDGSREKALSIVQKVISRLRGGEVPLEEVAIYTQLKKKPENYDIVSPELSAAKKAIARGKKIGRGSIVSYVITRNGKSSISERAELLEYAQNYDSQYYIDKQVLPSVMKILKELGYDEYELKHGGKQKGLGDFF